MCWFSDYKPRQSKNNNKKRCFSDLDSRKTVQFQTYQVAPIKNNISEKNCQLLKMNTPQYHVTLQKHYHEKNRQM